MSFKVSFFFVTGVFGFFLVEDKTVEKFWFLSDKKTVDATGFVETRK